jgi:hypothetical protein
MVLNPSSLRVTKMPRMKHMNCSNVEAAVEVFTDELKEIAGGQEIQCKAVTLTNNGNGTTTAKCD